MISIGRVGSQACACTVNGAASAAAPAAARTTVLRNACLMDSSNSYSLRCDAPFVLWCWSPDSHAPRCGGALITIKTSVALLQLQPHAPRPSSPWRWPRNVPAATTTTAPTTPQMYFQADAADLGPVPVERDADAREPARQRRVGHQHLAGDEAEQAAADGDDDRPALHQNGGAGWSRTRTSGTEICQTQNEQGPGRPAPAGGRTAHHAVDAHDEVRDQDGPDRGNQVLAASMFLAVLLRDQQLHADPEQQQAADDASARAAQHGRPRRW